MAEEPTTAADDLSPGTLLREAREERGIPLEEASRVTRIGQNYLTALEEDRFERLPNPAYVRGFLRNYAAFLGLSPDAVVSNYDRMVSPPAATEPARPKVRAEARPRKPAGRGPRKAYHLLPLLVAAALAMYYVAGRPGKAPVVSCPPVPAVLPAAVPPTVPAPVPAVAASAEPQPVAVPATPLPGGAAPAVEGVLRLKVNEETHLVMNIDDALVQEYQLRPGDVIEWKGEKSFALELSNAGGVEAELGGKRLRPLGGRGATARVVVRTDGRIE